MREDKAWKDVLFVDVETSPSQVFRKLASLVRATQIVNASIGVNTIGNLSKGK